MGFRRSSGPRGDRFEMAMESANRNLTLEMTGFVVRLKNAQSHCSTTPIFGIANGPAKPSAFSLLSDPRVRHRIQHVRQEVHRDIRQADRQNAALHQIV